MHAQNLLWYALLVTFVALLYRELTSTLQAAALATFFFAIDDAHVVGVAWIAGRNTVMAATFVALALWLHVRARKRGQIQGTYFSALALALGLFSGEGAIAAWAYLLPHALLLDRARARERALALVPAFVVTVAWALLYRTAGFGAHASGVYRDPLRDPLHFLLRRVPEAAPEVLREQLLVPAWPARLWPSGLHASLGLALSLLLVMALAFVLARATQPRRRALAFWALSLAGSTLPVCGVTGIALMPRLLFITGIAAFALLSELVVGLLERRGASFWPRALGAGLALPWIALHGALTLALAPRAHEVVVTHEATFLHHARALPSDLSLHETLLVLNTPNYFVTSMIPLYRPKDAPARVRVLGASATPVRLVRESETALSLEPQEGYLLEPYSQLVRAPERPFSRGQRILAGGLALQVEELTSDGRPAKIRIELPDPQSPRNAWVQATSRGYERVSLPEVGRSLLLTPE